MPPKSPTSIRSLGWVRLNVDKVLRAKIKQLAGDTPMIDYLRWLIDREIANKQGEFMPIDNTIAGVKRDTSFIANLFEALIQPDDARPPDTDVIGDIVNLVRDYRSKQRVKPVSMETGLPMLNEGVS
jgi:hypothetical protein